MKRTYRALLLTGDVVRLLRVSRSTIYRLEERGLINPSRTPHNRWRYFDEAQVQKLRQLLTPLPSRRRDRHKVAG